eukprot:2492516-Rhodomonas_salina.1
MDDRRHLRETFSCQAQSNVMKQTMTLSRTGVNCRWKYGPPIIRSISPAQVPYTGGDYTTITRRSQLGPRGRVGRLGPRRVDSHRRSRMAKMQRRRAGVCDNAYMQSASAMPTGSQPRQDSQAR